MGVFIEHVIHWVAVVHTTKDTNMSQMNYHTYKMTNTWPPLF